MAQPRQDRGGAVQAVTADETGLTCFIFRFLRRPLQEQAGAVGLREQLQKTTERAITAEARASEIEKRADNLNAELERVNRSNAELIQLMTEKLAQWSAAQGSNA